MSDVLKAIGVILLEIVIVIVLCFAIIGAVTFWYGDELIAEASQRKACLEAGGTWISREMPAPTCMQPMPAELAQSKRGGER